MLMSSLCVSAQEIDIEEEVLDVEMELVAPDGYEFADSLVYVRYHDVDSTYLGVDVLSMNVAQSEALAGSMLSHMEANPERTISGYRVRIFFDNKQSARVESEELEKAFQQQFPLIPTYRSYTNPFFKLVVGDYRSKSDAIKALQKILPFYPQAIVVKESIYFPAI